MTNRTRPIKVYIFITCLVDTFFPEVGESMVKVLNDLGVEVDFIEEQTCCGQPAFNSGYSDEARNVAKAQMAQFPEPWRRFQGSERKRRLSRSDCRLADLMHHVSLR